MSLTSTKANSDLVLGTAIQGELTISNSTINSFDVAEDLTGVTTVYVLKSGDVDYTSVAGTYSGGTFTYDSALSSPAIAVSDESKWVDEEVTYSYKPKEITVTSATTTNIESTSHGISEGFIIGVYNATDGYVEGTATITDANNINISSISLTTAPTKAFFKQKLHTFLAVEDTEARCIVEPKEILNIDSSSTVSSLVTTNELYEGETLYLDDGGTLVERTAGSVTTDSSSIVSSTDPFGDGSLITKCPFENNTTTLVGATITEVGSLSYNTGKFGNAIYFNGSSSNYLTTTDVTPLNTSFSFSIFVKSDTVTSTDHAIITQDGSGNRILKLDKTTNTITSYNDNGVTTTIETVPVDGEFHHICVVVDTIANSKKIFLDGVECTYSVNDYSNVNTPQGDIWLGRYYASSTNNKPPEAIEQYEFYSKALTPTEVNTLYTQTITKYSAPITATTNIPTSGYKIGEKALTVTGTPTTTTISATATESGLISIGDEIVLEGVE
jgi:hypothetical protein